MKTVVDEEIIDRCNKMSFLLGFSFSSIATILHGPDEEMREKLGKLLNRLQDDLTLLYYPNDPITMVDARANEIDSLL